MTYYPFELARPFNNFIFNLFICTYKLINYKVFRSINAIVLAFNVSIIL